MITIELINLWIAPLDAILDADADIPDVRKMVLASAKNIGECKDLNSIAAAYWKQRFMHLIQVPFTQEELKEAALDLRNDIVGLLNRYSDHQK